MKTEAEKLVTSAKPAGDVSVEIPSDLYKKPDVLSTDETLNLQMNTYNAYDQAVITYDFGTQKEVLDWNTIKDWVFFQDGQGMLSEEKIRAYVTSLAAKYNTIYYTRTFTTTGGQQITFTDSENNYGYLVDEMGNISSSSRIFRATRLWSGSRSIRTKESAETERTTCWNMSRSISRSSICGSTRTASWCGEQCRDGQCVEEAGDTDRGLPDCL